MKKAPLNLKFARDICLYAFLSIYPLFIIACSILIIFFLGSSKYLIYNLIKNLL